MIFKFCIIPRSRILLVKLREFHFSLADFGYKMNWKITSKDYKFKTEEEDWSWRNEKLSLGIMYE